MTFLLIKWVHILSSTLLFGTGLGSAFYKWMADRKGDISTIMHTNKIVVLADWLFTTPTVIIQPISGLLLVHLMGYSFTHSWLIATYVLYMIAGACWIPVVWLQIRMRDLAIHAQQEQGQLNEDYYHYARIWFWLGVPAFISMLGIFYLMVFKPQL